jgi:SMI1/KNR4 family protein SUKH-1
MHTSDHETILADIESRVDVRLPDVYRAFVLSDDAGGYYLFAGRRWFLAPLLEMDDVSHDEKPSLLSTMTVSAKTAPFNGVLELHAQALSELIGDYTNDSSGNSYEVKRLSDGFAVGEAEGDILYLDRFDQFSVWCYYQNSGDVELLAKTFETWLEKAVPDLPESEPAEPELQIEDAVVQIRAQLLKLHVREAIDRYIREYLIPWGDLDAARVYSNASNKILEKGYDRAMDQVATEIVDKLTRTDTD